MGLGAPKRRNKLSHDPNNTGWSRSTTNFGHRILSQQGWQPGQYLGAENANHSDHYTAANASHIRILLREDNLGLGAKVGGNKAETFGLGLFSGVLGRLNGKSDEQVQKQQDALRDAELRQYQVGKYGLMNFVSGGLLVGDRIEKRERETPASGSGSGGVQGIQEGRGKKRKAGDEEGREAGSKAKKQRTHKVQDDEVEAAPDQSKSVQLAKSERSRETKRRKNKQSVEGPHIDESSETALTERKSGKRRKKGSSDDTSPYSIRADDKFRLKEEKRARKEDRRKRKEAKRLKNEAQQKAALATAAPTQQGTQPANGGRHAVRHRYIQQKRMAGLDAQAMKEIFMIKGAA